MRGLPATLRSGRPAAAAAVVLAVAAAVWLRLDGAVDRVFGGETVRLQETDAWYHARLAYAVSQHPFDRIRTDPYAAFPDGQPVQFAGLPDALVAAVARAVALGRPDERTVDVVAAALPVAWAAAAVALVYLVAGRLFGRGGGALAALLLALSPGPFLERTRPGWADHHGAETALALLVLAVWTRALTARRPVRGGVAAGLALGAYLLSWSGGALLVLALVAWSLGQWLLELRLGEPAAVAARMLAAASLVALGVVAALPAWAPRATVQVTALLCLLATAALHARGSAARTTEPAPDAAAPHRPDRPLRWLLGGVLLGALLGIAVLGSPARLAHEVSRIVARPEVRTVAEAQPLLAARGEVGLHLVWQQHGLALFLFPFSLAWAARRAWRAAEPGLTLALVWGVTALAATLLQSRFGYYASGAAAILNAGLLWQGTRGVRAGGLPARALAATAGLVAVATLGAGLWQAKRSTRVDYAPSEAWFEALAWLRQRTPEPFGDPELYAAPGRIVAARAGGHPLSGDYGVMAWWDYGHWIVKLGRRVPVASPTGVGAARAARFLLAQSAAEAEPLADGVRYVILDHELPLQISAQAGLRIGKLPAIATWAEADPAGFARIAFARRGDALEPVMLYEPAYYRTLLARLYLFGGRAVEPRNSSWVVRTEPRTASDGTAWEELVESEPYPDYPSALAAAAARPGSRVVGLEPAASCVPLEALPGYRMVWESERQGFVAGRPAIRIFERSEGGV